MCIFGVGQCRKESTMANKGKERSRRDDAVIFLAGMKHCGKTTHGRRLACRWNCTWKDSDDLIAEGWHQRTGRELSVREIFVKVGAEGFAVLEAEVFCDYMSEVCKDRGRHVVSLGGRLPTNPGVEQVLSGIGLFVYLRADVEILFRRVMAGGRPPFLSETDPRRDFARLLAEREPAFLRYADLVVDVDEAPVETTSSRIIHAIEEAVDAR